MFNKSKFTFGHLYIFAKPLDHDLVGHNLQITYLVGFAFFLRGEVGNNFGAGMTGGMAFAFDKEGTLPLIINLDDVFYQQQMTPYWEDVLKNKITTYFNETNSQHAKDILDNWDRDKYLFWQIIPKEMVNKFEEPVLVETTKTA